MCLTYGKRWIYLQMHVNDNGRTVAARAQMVVGINTLRSGYNAAYTVLHVDRKGFLKKLTYGRDSHFRTYNHYKQSHNHSGNGVEHTELRAEPHGAGDTDEGSHRGETVAAVVPGICDQRT